MSVRFGDFELDRERRQLLRSGEPVPLEPKAYELLSLLVERRPRALSASVGQSELILVENFQ
jgi:DNA-binding winged helix-turn-helix (wHTH) protein